MRGPVVFNLDDFCDKRIESRTRDLGQILFHEDNGTPYMRELFALKERYPQFKATLFTIPGQCSKAFLESVKRHDWVEMAVHGFNHDYLDEMVDLSKEETLSRFSKIDFSLFCGGFKAPGWRLKRETIEACNETGLWVALGGKYNVFAPQCQCGFYIIGQNHDSWHAHTHNVENNWLAKDLSMLLKKWDIQQNFLFVSEAIVKP